MKIRTDKALMGVIVFGCFIMQVISYLGAPYTKTNSPVILQQLGNSYYTTAILKLIVLLSLIFLYVYQRRLAHGAGLASMNIVITLILFGSIFWLFDILLSGVGLYKLLCESTPPYVYVTVLAVCIGYDKRLWSVFLGYIKTIGFLSLILAVISYIVYIVQFPGMTAGNSSIMTYFVQAFWLLLITSISEDKSFSVKWLIIIMICAVFSLLFSSRSWTVQTVIWLIVYSFYKDRRKGITRTFKILICSIAVLGITYMLISAYLPEYLVKFMAKFKYDTRSYQYEELFSQTRLLDYFIGKGYFFKYNSAQMGGMYSYIDNAYILMLIRYGLVIGISYPLFFLIPVIKTIRRKQFEKKYAVIILMWLMALGGLSIFCVVIVDLKSIALAAVAGKCISDMRNYAT